MAAPLPESACMGVRSACSWLGEEQTNHKYLTEMLGRVRGYLMGESHQVQTVSLSQGFGN